MKIICEKDTLTTAINAVSRAVSPRSSIPALEGILLKTEEHTVYIASYDLEMGISTHVPATVEQPGNIILNAKLFGDIIRRLPQQQVEIEVDEKNMTSILSGDARFTLLGIDADEFPELPIFGEGDTFEIEQEKLKGMLAQTLFAVAATDTKPILTGSLFELKDHMLKVISVDGYRLAIRQEKIQFEQKLSFVVPGKTLSEIEKLLLDDETKAKISVSRKNILIEMNGYLILSRLLEGEFLNYKAAIPDESPTIAEVSAREFLDSVERASLLISDRMKSPLKLSFQENRLVVSCSTAIGQVKDKIATNQSGPDVEIGFNNKYLSDAVKAANCDRLRLLLNGPVSPMKILPLEGEDFLFLVLPVRIKGE